MTTTVGPFILPTFTLYLALAVVGGLGLAVVGSNTSRRLTVDAGIGALVGGYVGGRLLYAALNPALFAASPLSLLWSGPGGLDWHGAYVGALAGAWLVERGYARGRRVVESPRHTIGLVALPLVALAGWRGCAQVGCLYGVEVETLAYYPAWLVTEGRDIYGLVAPRYDTHRFGALLAGVLLVWAGVLWWRGRPTPRAFWAQSAVWCAGMFAIGFVRADYTPALPLFRADQWLDLLLLAGVLLMLVRSPRPAAGSTPAQSSAPPPAP